MSTWSSDNTFCLFKRFTRLARNRIIPVVQSKCLLIKVARLITWSNTCTASIIMPFPPIPKITPSQNTCFFIYNFSSTDFNRGFWRKYNVWLFRISPLIMVQYKFKNWHMVEGRLQIVMTLTMPLLRHVSVGGSAILRHGSKGHMVYVIFQPKYGPLGVPGQFWVFGWSNTLG